MSKAVLYCLTPLGKSIVQDNLGLAWKATFRRQGMRHGRLSFEEILSAAQMGLIRAVVAYREDLVTDPNNMRWSPYLMRSMDGAILEDMKGQGIIHTPNFLRLAAHRGHRFQPDAERAHRILADRLELKGIEWHSQ